MEKKSSLSSFLRKYYYMPEDIDEILMETVINIKTRNINNIRNNDKDIFNFLCTLTKNAGLDMKNKGSYKVGQNAVEYDAPINIKDGDEHVKSNLIDYQYFKKLDEDRLDREAGKTLRKMLKKVSQKQRVVGYLKYIFYMSCEEIATYLEVSVSDVKCSLFRLRKSLKELNDKKTLQIDYTKVY